MKRRMRRWLSIVVSLSMVVGLVPTPALAEMAEEVMATDADVVLEAPAESAIADGPGNVPEAQDDAQPEVLMPEEMPVSSEPGQQDDEVGAEDGKAGQPEQPEAQPQDVPDELEAADEESAEQEVDPSADQQDPTITDSATADVQIDDSEAAEDDDVELATQSSDIVASGESGTCTWEIDSGGLLTIRPTEGDEGTLGEWGYDDPEWLQYSDYISSARFEGTVHAVTCRQMFYYCPSLASIDLSGLDTSSVRDMGSMFDHCSSLTSLDVSGWDTSRVKAMNHMFYGCSSLSSLDVSEWDTSAVADDGLGSMFRYCVSLASFKVGASYDVSKDEALPWPASENGKWWSLADEAWYSTDEIAEGRNGIADTYLVNRNEWPNPNLGHKFTWLAAEHDYIVKVEEGDYWLGAFTAQHDGEYEFYASGFDAPPCGALYADAELLDLIIYNDGWDEEEESYYDNVRIVKSLTAGQTVYLKIGDRSGDSMDEAYLRVWEQTKIAVGDSYKVKTDYTGSWLGVFTAPQDGTYDFYTTGDSDTYGTLYSDTARRHAIASESAGGEFSNFRIRQTLDKGETVYLEVRGSFWYPISAKVHVQLVDASDLAYGSVYGSRFGSLVYTGNPVHAGLSVYSMGEDLLSEGTDYELVYYARDDEGEFNEIPNAPTAVGTYYVAARAIEGNEAGYHGETVKKPFEIVMPNELSMGNECDVEASWKSKWFGMFVAPRDGDYDFYLQSDDITTGYLFADATLSESIAQDGDMPGLDYPNTTYHLRCSLKSGQTVYVVVTGIKWLEWGDVISHAKLSVGTYDASDLSYGSLSFVDADTLAYTGEAVSLGVSVVNGSGNELSEGVDYTLVYMSDYEGDIVELAGAPCAVGSYYVAARAMAGNESGYHGQTARRSFTIAKLPENADGGEIFVGHEYAVNTEEDEHWLGVFTAPKKGTYEFYTTGSYDTYGELYSDADLARCIYSDDDGGEGLNFRMRVSLKKGQVVYLKVRGFGYSSVRTTLHVRKGSSTESTVGNRMVPSLNGYTYEAEEESDGNWTFTLFDALADLGSLPWGIVFGGDELAAGTDYTVRKGTYGVRDDVYGQAVRDDVYYEDRGFIDYIFEGIDRYYGTVRARVYNKENIAKDAQPTLVGDYEYEVAQEEDDNWTFTFFDTLADIGQLVWDFLFGGIELAEGTDYTVRKGTYGVRDDVYGQVVRDDVYYEDHGFIDYIFEGVDRYYGTVRARVYNRENIAKDAFPYLEDDLEYEATLDEGGNWVFTIFGALADLGQLVWDFLFGGDELVEGTDYTVRKGTYGTDVRDDVYIEENGFMDYIFRGVGRYYGAVRARVYGSRKVSIEEAQVVAADATYTGSFIEPEPTVTLGDVELVRGIDYVVAYKNNLDAGVATVVVTGVGIYEGAATGTFQILPMDISGATISGIADSIYTGMAQEPEPVVMLDGKVFIKGNVYGVSYKNNVDAGTATVIVTGGGNRGNYTGVVSATFEILPADLSGAEVSAPDQTYTGVALEPEVAVRLGGLSPEAGADYDVAYDGNTDAGTASVTVTAREGGNYRGKASGSFRILKATQDVTIRTVVRSVEYYPLQSAAQTVDCPIVVGGARGALAYAKADGSAQLSVSKSSGKVTVAKGTQVGTYDVKIRVTAAGDANHEAGSWVRSCTVKVADTRKANTLAVSAATVTAGSYALKTVAATVAPITVSGAWGTVSYRKDSGASCLAVNATTGKATVAKGTKEGTYTAKVSVTAAGDATHKPGTKQVSVTVKVADTRKDNTLAATAKAVTAGSYALQTAAATVTPIAVSGARGTLSYRKASGASCLSVNATTGKVSVAQGTKEGTYTAKVSVAAAGDATHKPATKTVEVTVRVADTRKANTLKVTAKAVTAGSYALKTKAAAVAPIAASGAKGAVSYRKSSGASCLTVNATTGKVSVAKGTKEGTYTAKVAVTAAGDATYKPATKQVSVTVKVADTRKANPIKVAAATKTASAKTLESKAVAVVPLSVTGAKGSVSYKKASGSAVLTVNATSGKVTIKKGTKAGTYSATVTVTAAGDATYKPLTKTVTVKVTVK